MRRVYPAFGTAVLLVYLAALASGWEPGSAKRGFLPPSVRQSPGGYRSYNFWRGGK